MRRVGATLPVCRSGPLSCFRSGRTLTFPCVANLPSVLLLRSQHTQAYSFAPPTELIQANGRDVKSIGLLTLKDNEGAKKKKRRKGRGPGSSKGKTCGFGHKGQNARGKGKVRPGFEGGQTPLYKRVRKYGYSSILHTRQYLPVSLAKIQWFIDIGKLDISQKITMKTLREAGVIELPRKKHHHGFQIVSEGAEWFGAKMNIEISKVEPAAREAIERCGGTVKEVYYHHLALKKALRKGAVMPPPQDYRQ